MAEGEAAFASTRLEITEAAFGSQGVAVRTTDGGDGTLEDGADGEGVVGRERRQVDLGMRAAVHVTSRVSASTTRAMASADSPIEPSPWPTRARARTATVLWLEAVYNRQRRHSSIDMLSPVNYENRYWDCRAAA